MLPEQKRNDVRSLAQESVRLRAEQIPCVWYPVNSIPTVYSRRYGSLVNDSGPNRSNPVAAPSKPFSQLSFARN